MLTESFTKLGAATATLAAVGGFMAVSADTATAASFTVKADITSTSKGVISDVGDVYGSFDYDAITKAFDKINLISVFTGSKKFPDSFTAIYDDFVSGSADTLTAKVTGNDFNGISLVFPDLNSLALGSSGALKAGSLTLVSQEEDYSAPLVGSITAVPTPVPTPALLPGLIGLGVASLRRKNDVTDAENA